MKQYEKEFAGFDNGEAFDKILDAVKAHNGTDRSWHNDAMPCILFDFDDVKGFDLVIWVDHKDPNASQFVEQRLNGSIKQFMFGERDEDGSYTEEWNYDDVDLLIAHVHKVMTS